ncbi:plasmid mobilization protein [Agathobaculum sp.]|uniref:plasmid mobilization protein n=1 Tax=Agathobaculum sp. TaxID=2048138 RepID=UPI002A7EB5CC|nr:hypothetical protein [Agathobaculum sp.]MDY3618461.1 hypothetical protein [Agathobaculum sp.]
MMERKKPLDYIINKIESNKPSPSPNAAQETLDADTYFADIIPSADTGEASPERSRRVRTIQRKTRLTAQEDALFLERVQQSGLPQSIFIRDAILRGEILSLALPEEAVRVCDLLMNEGGRIKKLVGQMVHVLVYNKQCRVLSREDIAQMNALIGQLRTVGDGILRKGDELCGYLQAHREP